MIRPSPRATQTFLLCVLLGGLALFFYATYANDRDRPSLQWPKVSGTITQSRWSSHTGGRGNIHIYYHADVAFTYSVNGQTYTGNRVKLWDPNLERYDGRARLYVQAHPVQSPVDVFYDPAHPVYSVLIPGANESANRTYQWAGVGIMVMAGLAWFRSRLAF